MILMIDNYDSFTYNLVQYFQMLGTDMLVRRNDEITAKEALALNPDAIVLSPGPGRPENAGIMPELISKAGNTPLLGICLGHQALGMAFGGRIVKAKRLMHGKLSEITHDGKGIFEGFTAPFKAVRYHSLVIEDIPPESELEVSARSEDGEIMAIRHKTKLIEGLQYHPESILTHGGKRQLENFLKEVYKR